MNNEKLHEIKKEDNSALGRFAIIIIIASVVGGVLGILSVLAQGNPAELISASIIGFLRFVTPFATIVITLVVMIVVICLYKKSRKIYQAWDGENEEEMSRIETYLSYALWFTSLCMILSFFFFAVGNTINIGNLYENISYTKMICWFVGFIFATIFSIVSQQKIVNFEKEMNPEKKGSIYDVKFAKKWEQSCDEAEKLTIYKAAYKSYHAVYITCIILWFFCFIGSNIWNFGLMPVAIISIIWLVQTSSYCLEAIRLTKNSEAIRK